MEKFLLFLFLSCCAWWDIRRGRIPNPVILTGIAACGIVCFISGPSPGYGAGGGYWGLALSAGRIISAMVILFPLFLFRMMGAGDIKVMAVVTGYMGWYTGFVIIFLGLVVSAVWSFIYMLRKHILIKRFNYLRMYFMNLFQEERILPYYCAAEDADGAGFCLAPFLWSGYMLWLVWACV